MYKQPFTFTPFVFAPTFVFETKYFCLTSIAQYSQKSPFMKIIIGFDSKSSTRARKVSDNPHFTLYRSGNSNSSKKKKKKKFPTMACIGSIPETYNGPWHNGSPVVCGFMGFLVRTSFF